MITIYKRLKTPLRRQLINLCKERREDWKGLCYTKSILIYTDKNTNRIVGFLSFRHTLLLRKCRDDKNFFMSEIRCVYYNSPEIFRTMILHMEQYALSKGCYLISYGHIINENHSTELRMLNYDDSCCEYCSGPNHSYYKYIQDESRARYVYF